MSEQRTSNSVKPTAWKLLCEAPKVVDSGAIVRSLDDPEWHLAVRHPTKWTLNGGIKFLLEHEWEYLPLVAQELELDRAAQVLVALAFARFISAVHRVSTADDREDDTARAWWRHNEVIRDFAAGMHSACGGRIPDDPTVRELIDSLHASASAVTP